MDNFRLSKFHISLLLLLALSLVSLIGVSHSFGMTMNEKGQMSACPFSGQAAICTMTFAEHLNIWQAMFTATPQKTSFFNFLILTLAFALASIIFRERLRLFLGSLTFRWRLHLKRNSFFQFFDHLKEAFSQGILNPKIYESATL